MFTGFTDATVDFLWGIRFNNERPWFEAHKETYLSELYRPMKDLGAEIYDFLSEQRPDDRHGVPCVPDLPGCPAAPRPGTL